MYVKLCNSCVDRYGTVPSYPIDKNIQLLSVNHTQHSWNSPHSLLIQTLPHTLHWYTYHVWTQSWDKLDEGYSVTQQCLQTDRPDDPRERMFRIPMFENLPNYT